MSSVNAGAVFFLGSRAHYQVLQQPESRSYDVENGNASTETIYQNPSVQGMWSEENSNCYDNEINMTDEKEKVLCNGIKKRIKRRQSETTLCERDNDMKPALLNHVDRLTPKPKSRRRISVLSFLASLARRRRRLDHEQTQYLQHLENALTACTYRESCRCLECQSRYFECDESEEYSSDESEYSAPYAPRQPETVSVQQYNEEEDDEVFTDTVPDDNTSADMLLAAKEPPSPLPSSSSCAEEDADMQLEICDPPSLTAITDSRRPARTLSSRYHSHHSHYLP